MPSESPKHGHEQIDRQQPDENNLPEAKVARGPMIGHHFGITIEEPLANAEYVQAGVENAGEANTKDDAKSENGIPVLMQSGEHRPLQIPLGGSAG